MNELIQVAKRQIGDGTIQTVSARDLHAFLEVGKDFSTWIKGRIEQYSFIEHHDFVTFDAAPHNGGAGNRGHRVEYAISLDMAKELAMVERNDKGKQARLYFIECERRSKAMADPMQVLQDPAAMRGLLLTYSEKVLSLEAENEEMKPKVAALDRISTADGSTCITNAAKTLQMRPKDMFLWMQANQWIYKRAGGASWVAYQHRIQSGMLEHKVTTVTRSDGTEKVVEQVLVTPKGMARLAELLTHPAAA